MSFDFSLVKKQSISFRQVNGILQNAYQKIKSANITLKSDPESCFTLSYDSMLKTTLALMLSNGYRPKTQLGHHKTLVNYAQYILKDRFIKITATYDRMRRKRNKLIYDAASVSETEAKQSIIFAEKYFQIIEEKIAQDNPQQKLWRPISPRPRP